MTKSELTKFWQEQGKVWEKKGFTEVGFPGGPIYHFSDKQDKFINSKKYLIMGYGGYRSGKTLALLVKMSLWCLFYPGTRVLLGRQFLSDIDRVLLPDLFNILPHTWYTHRVKDGVIRLFNGSEIVLFGLDAMQSGSGQDIKKAEQRIKGLNLSAYFLDQLEEIDEKVFEALNSRLSRKDSTFQQGSMTCNPANFWAYRFFKLNPKKRQDIELVEFSMYDNKTNQPADYIEKSMEGKPEDWVRRYVLGIWDMTTGLGKTVFYPEEIKKLEALVKLPEIVENSCEIYEQPRFGMRYQMGVDPSEGSGDPSSISVVSEEGRKVAKFNGLVPISAQGEIITFLYEKYYHPLIIPEVNAAGMALLEYIRDFNVYQRTTMDTKDNLETKKLGWKTSHASKQSLISNFKNLLRYGFPKIHDQQTVDELKTFVWSDEARQQGAGAEGEAHDDDVMSTMLAYWGMVPTKQTTPMEKLLNKGRYIKPQTSYI